MSPQPLGVAVAGLGFGEKVHLPALAAATDLEAVALWHPRQERLDAATAAHGLKGFSDWDALLADPAVDAVIIATPPAPALTWPAGPWRRASICCWKSPSR